jgi:hypothetical protein
MLTDEVDHRHLRALGIVEIRQSVCESGAKVKQRARGLLRHASVSVSCSCNHSLEETKNAAHLSASIQRRDNVYLRRSWVGKTSVYSTPKQRSY